MKPNNSCISLALPGALCLPLIPPPSLSASGSAPCFVSPSVCVSACVSAACQFAESLLCLGVSFLSSRPCERFIGMHGIPGWITHTRTLACTHARTHARTHTHTHTETHTYNGRRGSVKARAQGGTSHVSINEKRVIETATFGKSSQNSQNK